MNMPVLDCLTTNVRSGGVWEYISPSRLNCWLRCPLAFKFKYVDGIRTPTTTSLFLGKMVHNGVEILYRHRQLCVELSAEDVATRMLSGWDETAGRESMQFESVDQEDRLKKQAVGLIAAYMEHMAGNSETPFAVEARMEAPLIDPDTGEDLGIPLVGIVDLITDTREGRSIIDFKTSSRSNAPRETTHEIQLSSYAYLLRESTGDKESCLEIRSLIKTKVPKVEFHSYLARCDRHFRRLFSVIRAYLDDLDSCRFVFRPGFGCAMCDHRDSHCQTWMT